MHKRPISPEGAHPSIEFEPDELRRFWTPALARVEDRAQGYGEPPMRLALLCGTVLLAIAIQCRAATITDSEAAEHVGENATVCGTVASVYYARRSRARPTFLDFGADYPNESFVAVVFDENRAAFGDLASLEGQRVCVSGTIELYRRRPEIILHESQQLRQE